MNVHDDTCVKREARSVDGGAVGVDREREAGGGEARRSDRSGGAVGLCVACTV